MNENEREEIHSWIKESMKAENLSKMEIELIDTDDKGNGLVAVLVFAKVRGRDNTNNLKEIDLVVKMGKRGREFRENQRTLREYYKREVFFYEKVIPTFQEFQLNKNISKTLNAFPKCYRTFLFDDMEVVVMENMKARGFSHSDLVIPLNLAQIKLILESYARFHALSFALRDQNEEEFRALTANLFSVMKQMALTSGVFKKYDRGLENLKKCGRKDLIAEYEKLIDASREAILLEILDDVPQEGVLTHGDCHIGNFLFYYEVRMELKFVSWVYQLTGLDQNDERFYNSVQNKSRIECTLASDKNNETPRDVAIVDWQLCGHHSPVLDLSYFLYAALSKEDITQMAELLKFYYFHLKSFLNDLGSNADDLFPYKALIEHWRKYSIYGFIITTAFLELYYIDKENSSSFEDFQKSGDFSEFIVSCSTKLKREELYRERFIAIVEHFFNFSLT